ACPAGKNGQRSFAQLRMTIASRAVGLLDLERFTGLNSERRMLAFFMSAEPLAAEVAVPLIPDLVCPKSAGPSTIGAPTIEEETRAEEALDLPWHVVVHNDPVNLMSYVTMVFQRVFGYPRDKA